MTKKDRIAVSISITWILIMALVAVNERGDGLEVFSVSSSPVFFYWTYRFKKNEKKSATIAAKPDQLLKWNELLAKGAITQEEYDKAKRDLLG